MIVIRYMLASFIVLKCYSAPDLRPQELVLELLLSEDLSAFLPPADQVRHNCASGTIRQVLGNFKALVGQTTGNLIREALKLAESESAIV